MKNHVVVLGYTEGVTESIVSELLGAAKSPSSVVVVDDAADESPVPGVAFIKGELDEDSTLEKACCADAKSVIIYGKSDDQAVFSALAVAHLAESAGTSPHVVAYLRNPAKARHITHIGGRVTMVPKISCQMVVQEALDPGVSGVLSSVTSHTKGTQAVFGVKVPAFFKGRTFGELLPAVKDRCGMLLVGVSGQAGMDVNPAADTMIRPGDTVYVFGGARTQAKTVPWADL